MKAEPKLPLGDGVISRWKEGRRKCYCSCRISPPSLSGKLFRRIYRGTVAKRSLAWTSLAKMKCSPQSGVHDAFVLFVR